MFSLVRLCVAFTSVVVTGAVGVAAPAAPEPANTLEIVIGGGPHAGTYKPPSSDTMCMHFKQQKQFTAVFKDFDARDPMKVSEAGLNIANPDDTGPKQGDVLVAFGARDDKRRSQYSISVPRESAGPITLIRNGKGADVAFQGKTKDGIAIRVTAKCEEVEEL